ncbi:MAG: hypothetical protein OWT28_04640, partial [Firmicutes bacterium]|nr:hypothetical protein [Bacillota bacterium]
SRTQTQLMAYAGLAPREDSRGPSTMHRHQVLWNVHLRRVSVEAGNCLIARLNGRNLAPAPVAGRVAAVATVATSRTQTSPLTPARTLGRSLLAVLSIKVKPMRLGHGFQIKFFASTMQNNELTLRERNPVLAVGGWVFDVRGLTAAGMLSHG